MMTVLGVEQEDIALGVSFVDDQRMRELNLEHRGKDAVTDVLSFPIDGRDELPSGEPRALGDVVLCPEVVGDDWRWPLVHGVLHVLGHEHGAAMEARERALLT